MPESGRVWRAGGAEIGRSILAVVSSLIAFVVVSVLAFLLALPFVDGVVWPGVLGVFCGFAAATVLNATDVMARWSRRDPTGDEAGSADRADQRENGRVP
jgi:Na+-driven multidrug efflux pump